MVRRRPASPGRIARSLVARSLLALSVVGAACGGADGEPAVPAVTTSATGTATTTAAPPSTVPSPTTSDPAPDPVSEPAGSTDAPAGSTTTPPPTTALAGGPIPDAPDWFCAELAVESAEMVLEGLLNRVYADLGIELDRLDPDTVTMPRLQALVFAYVLDSPVVDAVELDLSARRLAAYVDRSCGHGFPIMEAMADLFAPGT